MALMLQQKGRRPKPTPPWNRSQHRSGYIFFSSHILVVAFHVPPAFAQSASVFAAVAPAKTGPEKASARVIAKVAIRIFMGFLRYAEPPQTNVFSRIAFQETDPIGVKNGTEADAPRDCTGFTRVGPWNLPYSIAFCRLGFARGVINMAGRYQGFHSLNTGNIEIFWRADGWCWWSRAPGCSSESAPVGPFLTSTDAYLHANGGACLIPRPERLDKVA